ncbi:hypothetical protein GYB59_14085 [bacterium]|nr:hypothetical protein [bacterium]
MEPREFSQRNNFEHWLVLMDDFLELFIARFPQEERALLDFTPESLDIVEAWILRTYADMDEMLAPEEAQTVNCVACYVGETYCKHLGAKWDIRLDDPSFAFYGIPILVNSEDSTIDCPLTLVTASADRRNGQYLRTVLENL